MIYTILVNNVNEALSSGLNLLARNSKAEESPSRNGPVRRAKGPVVIETLCPTHRVLFSPLRNANPFFHLFESLWMLAGRQDLPWLAQFNKQMATYSDDGGKTQPAAYGHRWRKYFGDDQLEAVVDHLARDPQSRRAVVAMWNPALMGDLYAATGGSKDVPCNTTIYFQIANTAHGSVLNMTVTCRSNDVLWGAHGANAVHFSVLQEYIAAKLSSRLQSDIGVGRMVQFANDYHLYTDVIKVPPERMAADADDHDYYALKNIRPRPMFNNDVDLFDREVHTFCDYADPALNGPHTPVKSGMYSSGYRVRGTPHLDHPWLREVALPMLVAWDAHKQSNYAAAVDFCHKIASADWRQASREWLLRKRDRNNV